MDKEKLDHEGVSIHLMRDGGNDGEIYGVKIHATTEDARKHVQSLVVSLGLAPSKKDGKK